MVKKFLSSPSKNFYKLKQQIMYKSVTELSQNELEELRSRLYHQFLDDGSLEEVMEKEIDSEVEIPMDLVKAHYADTLFVEEDFFCNLEE